MCFSSELLRDGIGVARCLHDLFSAHLRLSSRVCYARALHLARLSRQEGSLLVRPRLARLRLRFSGRTFTCKMSKVRVSNGSPTLERVDARQTDHARPPVCRNLFGSVDREEFARDVNEQMLEMEKASEKKWNYNFAKNEPLAPGDYEWQEVDAKEMPEFYTRPPHAKRDTPTGTVDHNGNHDYLLNNVTSVQGDSDNAEHESRSDSRTPRKRPSTEDQGNVKCFGSLAAFALFALRSRGTNSLPSRSCVMLKRLASAVLIAN